MPGFAGDALAGLVGLYDEDLGMIRQPLRCIRMDMQLAEPGTERLVLLDRELLIAKKMTRLSSSV
jgi:hypothetical protein